MGKKKTIAKKREFDGKLRTYEVTLKTGTVFRVKATHYTYDCQTEFVNFFIRFNTASYIDVADIRDVVSVILQDDLTTELADCMELKETVQ